MNKKHDDFKLYATPVIEELLNIEDSNGGKTLVVQFMDYVTARPELFLEIQNGVLDELQPE